MMRHLVGEAPPELEHLRAGAALWQPKRQPQISGRRGLERWAVDFPVTLRHVRI
jgi:hypothetical protein